MLTMFLEVSCCKLSGRKTTLFFFSPFSLNISSWWIFFFFSNPKSVVVSSGFVCFFFFCLIVVIIFAVLYIRCIWQSVYFPKEAVLDFITDTVDTKDGMLEGVLDKKLENLKRKNFFFFSFWTYILL